MKKVFSSILLISAICLPVSAYAADACEVVICMAGKAMGENPSECSSAVSKYFGIKKTKKGKFKADATAAARESFLQECKGADKATIGMIQSAFGKQR